MYLGEMEVNVVARKEATCWKRFVVGGGARLSHTCASGWIHQIVIQWQILHHLTLFFDKHITLANMVYDILLLQCIPVKPWGNLSPAVVRFAIILFRHSHITHFLQASIRNWHFNCFYQWLVWQATTSLKQYLMGTFSADLLQCREGTSY